MFRLPNSHSLLNSNPHGSASGSASNNTNNSAAGSEGVHRNTGAHLRLIAPAPFTATSYSPTQGASHESYERVYRNDERNALRSTTVNRYSPLCVGNERLHLNDVLARMVPQGANRATIAFFLRKYNDPLGGLSNGVIEIHVGNFRTQPAKYANRLAIPTLPDPGSFRLPDNHMIAPRYRPQLLELYRANVPISLEAFVDLAHAHLPPRVTDAQIEYWYLCDPRPGHPSYVIPPANPRLRATLNPRVGAVLPPVIAPVIAPAVAPAIPPVIPPVIPPATQPTTQPTTPPTIASAIPPAIQSASPLAIQPASPFAMQRSKRLASESALLTASPPRTSDDAGGGIEFVLSGSDSSDAMETTSVAGPGLTIRERQLWNGNDSDSDFEDAAMEAAYLRYMPS
jgi:hypothetical protein